MLMFRIAHHRTSLIYYLYTIYSCHGNQHRYSSLQCHMILQKSFWYADLLKKHFWLLSMLITLLWKQSFFSGFVDEQSIQKNSIYLKSKSFVKCPSGGGWEDGRHARLHAVQTEWESAPFCVCVRWPERSGFCTLETVSSCSNPNLWYPATEMYCVGSNGWWGTGARWVLVL